MKLPDRVTITEVGPRDGLQNEARILPLEQKVELINRLSRTGLTRIEAASFVSPKAIPQMADAADVMAAIDRVSGRHLHRSCPKRARRARRHRRGRRRDLGRRLRQRVPQPQQRQPLGRTSPRAVTEIAALCREAVNALDRIRLYRLRLPVRRCGRSRRRPSRRAALRRCRRLRRRPRRHDRHRRTRSRSENSCRG